MEVEFLGVVLGTRFKADYVQRLESMGSMRRKDHEENLVAITVVNEILCYITAVAVYDT
jgi:hypothetical protein